VPRQFLSALRTVLVVVSLLAIVRAQIPGVKSEQTQAARPRRATPRGILTDRLSQKDLRNWRTIERFALAKTRDGRPVYPVLRALWDAVNDSPHAVFIELAQANRLSSCTAGNFRIESFDPKGLRHTAVIWLSLTNIDQAYVGPSTAYLDGFVPFSDLSREERYAEVLGHELAHAAHILGNFELARKVEELVQQTNELLLTTPSRSPRIDHDLHIQIGRRDVFLRELEAQAEEKEKGIWREIIARRAQGKRKN
jgi:hypothetical protein